ncbi:toxin-antitoxin system YwqK family antitoxin [Fibrobacterota bacterium]
MDRVLRLTALILTGLFLLACQRIETRKEKYPSGKLKARWEVTVSKEGEVKDGVYEEFYESGQAKSIVNYVDNKEHGVYRSYHENGKMESEIYFLEGLMDGSYKEWYDNGKKKRFAEYKDGQLHGSVKTWDSEGNVVAQGKFKKGACKKGDCNKISSGNAIRVN